MADDVYKEFKAYWSLSDELIEKATKEQLAEVARILALQSAHYARKYGELPLPALFELLKATQLDQGKLALLRDGTEALVGVLAVIVGEIDDDTENPVQ